jgi:hypothetical protein
VYALYMLCVNVSREIHIKNGVCNSHVCLNRNADEVFIKTHSLEKKCIFYSV